MGTSPATGEDTGDDGDACTGTNCDAGNLDQTTCNNCDFSVTDSMSEACYNAVDAVIGGLCGEDEDSQDDSEDGGDDTPTGDETLSTVSTELTMSGVSADTWDAEVQSTVESTIAGMVNVDAEDVEASLQ